MGVMSDFVAIEFNSVKAKVGKISREIRLFALMKLEKDAKGTIPVEKIKSVPEAGLGKTTPLIVPFVPEYRTEDVKNVLIYIIFPALFVIVRGAYTFTEPALSIVINVLAFATSNNFATVL